MICEYCVEYNGDNVEETGGFDYYSCELMNNRDLEKYGQYDSLANQVFREDCSCYLGEKCKYKELAEE